MNKPMVSICCLTYKHENFISDAIEGFLMQETEFPIEIIIHDDASPDRTPEIVETYRKMHPDIIKPIYQKENQHSKGVDIGEKYMWPKVTGKYIALCEGDDFWIDPAKLQKQVDYMERHPECTMCFHAARYLIYNSDVNDRLVRPYRRNKTVTLEDFILEGGGFFPTASLLFRSHLIFEFPEFFKKRSLGDYPIALFMASQGTVYYLDEVMAVYRYKFPGSWTSMHLSTNEGEIINREKDIVMLRDLNEYTGYAYNSTISRVILDKRIEISQFKNERLDLKEPENYDLYKDLDMKNKLKFLFRLRFPKAHKIALKFKKKYRYNVLNARD